MFDRNSLADYQTLKTEITTDPRAYGYAAKVTAQDYAGLAVMLNQLRPAGQNGNVATAITVRRGIRSSQEVMSAIDGGAFAALTVGVQNFLNALVSPGTVDLSNDAVRTSLQAIFPANSSGAALASRNRLIALADKNPASRFEELFGVDQFADEEMTRAAVTR